MKKLLNIFFFLSFSLSTCFIQAQEKAALAEDNHHFRIVAVMQDGKSFESVSNTISFVGKTSLYLPNAFSPDQDGHNDTFGAIGLNATNYQLQVFDRWGTLLFKTENINQKWDGTHKGKRVSEGVYVYQLRATEALSGKAIQKQGTVSVVL